VVKVAAPFGRKHGPASYIIRFAANNSHQQAELMRTLSLLLIHLALTGCASTYTIPSGEPSATIAFDMSSDSSNTTGRSFTVWTYEDTACTPSKNGAILASKGLSNTEEKFGPLKISATSPFTFAVSYLESRIGQNRECSFTATFTPQVGLSYRVRFAAKDQAGVCGIQITDSGGVEVDYASPELSCAETFVGKIKNGGGGGVNWRLILQ